MDRVEKAFNKCTEVLEECRSALYNLRRSDVSRNLPKIVVTSPSGITKTDISSPHFYDNEATGDMDWMATAKNVGARPKIGKAAATVTRTFSPRKMPIVRGGFARTHVFKRGQQAKPKIENEADRCPGQIRRA